MEKDKSLEGILGKVDYSSKKYEESIQETLEKESKIKPSKTHSEKLLEDQLVGTTSPKYENEIKSPSKSTYKQPSPTPSIKTTPKKQPDYSKMDDLIKNDKQLAKKADKQKRFGIKEGINYNQKYKPNTATILKDLAIGTTIVLIGALGIIKGLPAASNYYIESKKNEEKPIRDLINKNKEIESL